MVTWIDEKHLTVGGTRFTLEPLARARDEAGSFVLRKTRWLTEQYLDLSTEPGLANVFELGIDQAGSTALLALLLCPRKLVAIDIEPRPSDALAQFILAGDLGRSVRPHYGVNQADRQHLEEILKREFGSEPLDLVIDDASHYAHETTMSFNVLFPRLRSGGAYIIEDWEWDHAYERVLRARSALPDPGEPGTEDRVGPTRLVLELAIASGTSPEIVAEVAIRHGFVVVRRGRAPIDTETFDISQCYGAIGRRALS